VPNAKEPFLVSEPPAKFFVNDGVVSTREDMLNLLRPLLKQTVTYRYFRGRDLVTHGTGWVERIVTDQPDVSSFFTPIAELVTVLSEGSVLAQGTLDQVQNDERVVLEFAPIGDSGGYSPFAPHQLEFDTSGFIQMELLGQESADD